MLSYSRGHDAPLIDERPALAASAHDLRDQVADEEQAEERVRAPDPPRVAVTVGIGRVASVRGHVFLVVPRGRTSAIGPHGRGLSLLSIPVSQAAPRQRRRTTGTPGYRSLHPGRYP